MPRSVITPSLEDCLESIYYHFSVQQGVKAIDIAKSLNISRPFVTEMLKKLAAKGFINYTPYGIISMTPQGIKSAQKIFKKHTYLTSFFENVLCLDSDEAQKNACQIEHVISEKAFKRLVTFTEFVQQNKKDFSTVFQKRK